MTSHDTHIQHAARWAAKINHDRAARVAKRYGDDMAPEILADASKIDAARRLEMAKKMSEWGGDRDRDRTAEQAAQARWDAEQDMWIERTLTGAKQAARLRRRVLASLRRMGFVREAATSGASVYYRHLASGLTVRISDHHVPLTAARQSDMAHGGHTWADSDLSLVIDDDTTSRHAAEWLVSIRRMVRRGI